MKHLKIMAAFLCCAAFLSGCAQPEESSITETDEASASGTDTGEMLYQSEYVNIEYTGKSSDDYYTYLNFNVENLTDRQLVIAANDISINDAMIDPFLYAPIESGVVSEVQMEFSNTELEEQSLENFGTVEFSFFITDGSSSDGLETSGKLTLDLGEFTASERKEGIVLYDSGGLKVVCIGVKPDDSLNASVTFDIQNNMGQKIDIDIRDVYIDGSPVDAQLYHSIGEGKHRVCDMYFWDEGVLTDSSEKIEFVLGAFDPETFDCILETDTLSADLKSLQN